MEGMEDVEVITQKSKRDLIRIRVPIQVYSRDRKYHEEPGASTILVFRGERSRIPAIVRGIKSALEGLGEN